MTPTKDTPIEELNTATFPEPTKVNGLAFQIPHCVKHNEDGTVTIKQGGTLQLEHEIEYWFSFEEEKDYPFSPVKLTPIKLMGRPEIVLDENSKPTAGEFLKQSGQRTLWQFDSTLLPMGDGTLPSIYERPVWKNRRVWITLP